MIQKPEILSPAGSLESLETAVLYGADAVYIGGELFSLRAKAKNFGPEEMRQAVDFCHQRQVRLYVAVNIIAHDRHFQPLDEYLLFLQELGVDALIMADAGMIARARQLLPAMPIHLSTQASATNTATFRFWHEQGVSRIVCARELSLEELAYIRAHTPDTLELEAFVHGAMCMSISGRCLLSAYLNGRDANLGNCSQPCRWKYALMEETRPGEYMPVLEGEEGSYILNARDLCMIDYLPEMIEAGIMSLKIEGRMKTPLYVGMVTGIYREALEDLTEDPALYREKRPYYRKMLEMVSHRAFSTGFYLDEPGSNGQIYDRASYEKSLAFGARILEEADPAGWVLIQQRGKFLRGQDLFLLSPERGLLQVGVEEILTEGGKVRESAPHAMERLRIRTRPSLSGIARPGLLLALEEGDLRN